MTTRAEIEHWLRKPPEHATHVLIICDTYDQDDYPVYVLRGQDPRKVEHEHLSRNPMARRMECYDLRMDLATQLAEYRALHY
jgi:hypothetical protein